MLISSFYLSQTEHRPLSQLRVMRDVQASMKKTLETNSVRCAKSLYLELTVILPIVTQFKAVKMCHLVSVKMMSLRQYLLFGLNILIISHSAAFFSSRRKFPLSAYFVSAKKYGYPLIKLFRTAVFEVMDTFI